MPLFHITTASAWREAQRAGVYRAASLETEGFIHLSTHVQWPLTASRFFRARSDLVLLVLEPSRLEHEVRFEAADGDAFPHLYGTLALAAVVRAHPLSVDADGIATLSEEEPTGERVE